MKNCAKNEYEMASHQICVSIEQLLLMASLGLCKVLLWRFCHITSSYTVHYESKLNDIFYYVAFLRVKDISVLTTVVRFTWHLTGLTSSSATSVMVDGELAVALFLQGVVCWGVAGRFLGEDMGLEFFSGDDVPASVKSEVIFDASNKAYKI